MLAIEFRLKVSSMYSIRVPYSYQCARTYPLPAPSTIKGLCANALWRKEDENPIELMGAIQKASLGATSRAERPIVVSSNTISIVDLSKKEGKKTNALLRQFAFTPYIDCLIVFKDGSESLGKKVEDALKVSPVYLGDSESLVCVKPESISSVEAAEAVTEGKEVTVNSLLRFDFIKDKQINEKGVVLYMQDDPCADDAVLDRYVAPLRQEGDTYRPLDYFSFVSAKKGLIIRGERIQGVFCEDKSKDEIQKPKRGKKKKA
jgi:CRISPR-associated Cas5-like protein